MKKGVMLKAGVIGAVLFLIALLFLGALVPSPAQASSCEDTGPGTAASSPISGGGQTSGPVGAQQLANAKVIDQVAVKLGLPGQATLIALMTAMQESTLQNLNYGDRDSLGLFQQRPSQAWGTPAQIRTPSYAAESFFLGRGTNPGLVDIAGWQTMPPGVAAQKVQRSAFPDLYAGHESAMRALAEKAGIDLERAGTNTGKPNSTEGGSSDGSGSGDDAASGECPDTAGTPGGSAGGKFTDGTATWTLNNPRSVEDAIAWAKAHAGANSTGDWYQRCLAFTAIVYGWQFSGVTYAIDHFSVVPKDMQHRGDRHPPPGALLYWDTGHRAGHIAVYLGNGQVASNDILRPGYIDVVDIEMFETKWRAKYIGWTPPFFPKGG
ncbi:peptidase M23 [Streptomyces sp. N35]|uniref:peptidase M23 n=1 Tax=Streptomyces sp. N35 TaxID=2795730 RepID=UPI0027DD33F6|nr:peptidase M23 [Streptomyces sp. N35]